LSVGCRQVVRRLAPVPLAEARNAYSYSANGVKLKVVKKYNSNFNTSPVIGSAVNISAMDVTQTTDYVSGKIFENNALGRIFVDGGYIKGGVYYFYETDHLGDNRTVINQSGTVTQRNDYYPYGMQMGHNDPNQGDLVRVGDEPNAFKFSGKELDVMGGLNLYDFSARSQDPTLGRFTTVDPLAEKYYSWSPYVYCAGNPVNAVDPDGMDAIATRYVDPSGKTIINTNDGRDDVYVVPWNRIQEFKENIYWTNKTLSTDFTDWNDYWRGEFKQVISEATLKRKGYYSLHGEEAKAALAKFLITGDLSDYDSFVWAEVHGQWNDPVLVATAVLMFAHGMVGVVGNAPTAISRMQANLLKDFKNLINQLSKPGSKLTQVELNELRTLAQKHGGTVRADLTGVKGTGINPHVHIEGLGKSVESRHIWLQSGVN
jgi:RHS repeat-associated protein